MKIKRVNRGRNHWYIDEETGAKVSGVTTLISKGVPKGGLVNWAATTAAEYAVDHWDELCKLTPSARLKAIAGAHTAARNSAALRGTRLHRYAEPLTRGESIDLPAEHLPLVEQYARFLDDFDVQDVHMEAPVYSVTYRHAGTLDLIADIRLPDLPEYDHVARDGEGMTRALLDIKTGNRVYGDAAVQLAGYRFSEWLVTDDPGEDGQPIVIPMPAVDWVGVVHVTDDDYDLLPAEAEREQYDTLLGAQRMARHVETARDLIGEPVPKPAPAVEEAAF